MCVRACVLHCNGFHAGVFILLIFLLDSLALCLGLGTRSPVFRCHYILQYTRTSNELSSNNVAALFYSDCLHKEATSVKENSSPTTPADLSLALGLSHLIRLKQSRLGPTPLQDRATGGQQQIRTMPPPPLRNDPL